MSRPRPGTLSIAAALLAACLGPAAAAPVESITPFSSSSLNRDIHGDERSADLSAGGRDLGSADAFFGVDSLSTVSQQYLTSGLQWRSSAATAPLLAVSALHTESQGNALTGQTLMRAESGLDLGGRWYLPTVTGAINQVRNTGIDLADPGGRAATLGLTDDIAGGHYSLAYFRADPQYNALGSAIVAGDRGLELGSRYAIGSAWQLSNSLRWHEATATALDPGLVQNWTLQRNPALTDIGSPWLISARFGDPLVSAAAEETPMALSLGAQTLRVRDWRVDSTLGWYHDDLTTPDGLPVAGGMWRMSASRGLNIAGLDTEFSPNFAVGGSRYACDRLGSRTGLSVAFPSISRGLNLNVDYLSTGWGPAADRNDVQLMLQYTQSAGSFMPALSSVARSLHLPWERNY